MYFARLHQKFLCWDSERKRRTLQKHCDWQWPLKLLSGCKYLSPKKYFRHSFCYIDLFHGKWACKDDNDHSNMPGRVAMTGDLFLSSIVDWFSHSMPTIHIILIPSSFSTSWERRHQSQSIEIQRWRNISHLFWIFYAKLFCWSWQKQAKKCFSSESHCVQKSHH